MPLLMLDRDGLIAPTPDKQQHLSLRLGANYLTLFVRWGKAGLSDLIPGIDLKVLSTRHLHTALNIFAQANTGRPVRPIFALMYVIVSAGCSVSSGGVKWPLWLDTAARSLRLQPLSQ